MPGDHIAADAAAHGRRGVSYADREQVTEVLKAAFVQGRLTRGELGARVGQAFTAQTYAELTEVTADLPAGLIEVRPPRPLARTRPRVSTSAAISAGAFAMLAALMGMIAAVVTRSAIGLRVTTVSVAVVGILVFGALMAASWQGRAPNREKSEP